MEKKIALIPGDGIGPDVVAEAVKVLDKVAEKFGHKWSYDTVTAGGCSIDKFGKPLIQEELDKCLKSDAVLLGAVGGPKWDNLASELRPEKALLGLRGGMKVFANLRPAVMFKQLKDACPLKDEIVGDGLDILIVRELISGIYFGDRGTAADGKSAWDTERYTWEEIERIVRMGFEFAQKRQKRLCVVDKANILNSSQLWRKVTETIKGDYPDVTLSYLYIDNASMQMVRNPRQFDVIATSNMFGDILSDEASQITGSIGMLASASLGESGPGLYEPIHGSAPDIAGKDLANPLATILSAAMLLRYSFGLETEAKAIETAVEKVLDEGYRTGDIAGSERDAVKAAGKLVGTKAMGQLVVERL
ncbi:3-isopropylmalate dehydrogenase [Treponema sp.]|uniref:3-isopropylmalate dehydrogenase n=1 Tax=Treponema sp. TaxID=166 RepID=UPI001D38F9A3|nr:3-isopropylmalate dehydrogenase [Treponema sp.]MBS7241399.1 3-isopropylmalate dehydrogenase [Treponema sp.]MCI6442043.1 3-isopropylmalate dehydrogenase [Spirochaetia bacterium]MDY4132391.1 3-isopropylmalate dehydrogenase [Treponema sp.]